MTEPGITRTLTSSAWIRQRSPCPHHSSSLGLRLLPWSPHCVYLSVCLFVCFSVVPEVFECPHGPVAQVPEHVTPKRMPPLGCVETLGRLGTRRFMSLLREDQQFPGNFPGNLSEPETEKASRGGAERYFGAVHVAKELDPRYRRIKCARSRKRHDAIAKEQEVGHRPANMHTPRPPPRTPAMLDVLGARSCLCSPRHRH